MQLYKEELVNNDSQESDNALCEALSRTSILNEATNGSLSAQELLAPLVYTKLRRMARSFLLGERRGHTLQPTDLVHEAYLRLFDQTQSTQKSQTHFVALAATMMRRILINHAVARNRQKRGSGATHLTLSAAEFIGESAGNHEVDLLALDRILTELAELDERMARIVELRYFGGMSIEEVAVSLQISPATVKREWMTAKLWLKNKLDQSNQ
jgi:RNA polymerase sigma-70 factor (ECF subfamily)